MVQQSMAMKGCGLRVMLFKNVRWSDDEELGGARRDGTLWPFCDRVSRTSGKGCSFEFTIGTLCIPREGVRPAVCIELIRHSGPRRLLLGTMILQHIRGY